MSSNVSNRAFKTARFSKDAKKASSYAGLTEQQLSQLLVNGDFVEICYDDKTEIQK